MERCSINISLYRLVSWLFSLLPINKRKIFFLSYYGNQYGCNPKYLSEFFVQNMPNWDIVWGFTNPTKHNVDGIRKVKYLSFRYFYELCTSAVFVTNYLMPEFYIKRKDQLYLQTWHSSLRLKMIEKDAEDTLPSGYIKMAKRDLKQVSALLSGCQYSTDIFRHCLWNNVTILPTGTPRISVLFKDDDSLRCIIKERIGIHPDKKVILYAPTFRKDNSLDYYDINFESLSKSVQTKWSGEWNIVLRLHPHLRDYSNQLIEKDSDLIDVTSYDDIQELLYIADILISDYSSLIFDFCFTKRPCILYTPDIEQYTSNDRKLYFNIQKLPFPVCLNNEQLTNCINHFDLEAYRAGVNTFIETIGSFESENSCEKIADYIVKQLP